MGVFIKEPEPLTLAKQEPTIGVFPHFCVNRKTTMILRRKGAFGGCGDFDVRDLDGVPVVFCKGDNFSLSNRQRMTDAEGTGVCHIRNKLFAFIRTFFAEDAQERELFRVTNQITLGSTKLDITFTNASTGCTNSLLLKMGFWGNDGVLSLGEGGQPIAQFIRTSGPMKEMTGYREFRIHVAAGVDLALVAGIAMIYCENERQKKMQQASARRAIGIAT